MDKARINEFIGKLEEALNDNTIPLIEIWDNPEIGDGFHELGFAMDSGHSFVEKYGKDAFWNPRDLEKLIDSEKDVLFLGTALFSKWRYYNHWSMGGEDIRDCELLRWFNIVISRILELTKSKAASNSENPQNGAIFQSQVRDWFIEHYGNGFELETKIPIGNPPKDHKFDIVNIDKKIAIECKRYTWTESGNVPSAKMGFANEAAFYLSFLPGSFDKYIVMLYDYNQKRKESLAEYYYRTNKHLIGSTKVAEYNPDTNEMDVINHIDDCEKSEEITSISMVSNNICYGAEPQDEEEVEQCLTVESSGRVRFSARNYKQYLDEEGYCREKQVDIGKWKAGFILKLADNMSSSKKNITDVGSYSMEVRYCEKTSKKNQGPLIGEVFSHAYGEEDDVDFTRLIRRYIPVYGLWAFDSSLSPDYEGKKAIYLFAEAWEKFFNSPDSSKDFDDGFGQECEALGFQMDCGEKFVTECAKFGCKANYGEGLKESVAQIDDIEVIGSGAFSYWRGLTHWSGMYQLGTEECGVLLCLMKRLKELTGSKQEV